MKAIDFKMPPDEIKTNPKTQNRHKKRPPGRARAVATNNDKKVDSSHPG